MFNTSEILMRSERGAGVGSQCRLICQQVVLKKLREELRPSVREERDQFVTIQHFLLYPSLLAKQIKGMIFFTEKQGKLYNCDGLI